ncbi:Carbon-nitrogen hydrolase [Fusarium chlamydosporum]
MSDVKKETYDLDLREPAGWVNHGKESLELAEPQSTSSFVKGLREAAREHKVAVHVGIHHRDETDIGQEQSKRILNRTIYINSDGEVDDTATYDKLHAFDYGKMKESDTVQPGATLTAPFDSPIGRIGSLICFDLRFPEAPLALAQPGPRSAWHNRPAQIITYPSAFTLKTGPVHWETLLKARAVETQSYVIASAQVGRHNDKRASWGQSIVVDPWGRVVLKLKGVKMEGKEPEGTPEEGAVGDIGFVDVDLEKLEQIRKEMPLQRRTDVYPELVCSKA